MISKLLRKHLFRFSNTGKNPYESLGVKKSASDQQIKQAYYKLAKIYHPDITSTHSQKFRDITQAYNILKDPIQRREFDQKKQSFNKKYQNINMNEYYNQTHNNFRQGTKFQYPAYDYDNAKRFNKQFIRERMSERSSQHSYFNQRKSFRYTQMLTLALLQIFGFIYGLKIIRNVSKQAQRERQLEQFRYFGSINDDEEDYCY